MDLRYPCGKKIYVCPHGKRNKYYCKQCAGNGICKHSRNRFICKECDGTSLCQCGVLKYKCKICGINTNCVHKIKRARCEICRRDTDRICQLNDFKNNEICPCVDCTIADKVCRGLICFVCRKGDTYRLARCNVCYNRFQSNFKTSERVEEVIDNKEILPQITSSNKTSKDILEKDLVQHSRKLMLDRAEKRLNRLHEYINDRYISLYDKEKALKELFFYFTRDRQFLYIFQVTISSKYLNYIEEFLDFFKESEERLITFRIIWFLIKDNVVVMKEVVTQTQIFEKLNNILKSGTIDIVLNDIVNNIISHLKLYGF